MNHLKIISILFLTIIAAVACKSKKKLTAEPMFINSPIDMNIVSRWDVNKNFPLPEVHFPAGSKEMIELSQDYNLEFAKSGMNNEEAKMLIDKIVEKLGIHFREMTGMPSPDGTMLSDDDAEKLKYIKVRVKKIADKQYKAYVEVPTACNINFELMTISADEGFNLFIERIEAWYVLIPC